MSPTPPPPDPTTTPLHPADATDAPWWRDPVIYQIYPRSWADGNGDGMGDLPGIIARLPHVARLGADAIWLSPVYRSPMHDAGYDVADYRDIDPRFGTLADADALVARAHELGLRVLLDLVPNHTSSEHPWFQAAVAAGPGSPERDRYLFRAGRGEHGELPPNNWPSVFGGQGWTRLVEADGTPGPWYLHLFDSTQPDLDWSHPDVAAEFLDILTFWAQRGVDGFRVDVAHGLVKDPALPDWDGPLAAIDVPVTTSSGESGVARAPMWDQDGVHDIYRSWRAHLDTFSVPGADADRILCAEAWVNPEARLARYIRPDEMQQAFNFDFLDAAWRADELRRVVTESYRSYDRVGAPATWVLNNHDVVRTATRLGYAVKPVGGVGPDDPQPDAELGLRRARAGALLMLALPGGAYLYQGEELGLPDHTTLPHELRQDPAYLRTRGTDTPILGRDGCRVPIPWERDAPAHGFGPGGTPWLPQPDSYGDLAVDVQEGVEGSTLELYRAALRLRRDLHLGRGSLAWADAGVPTALAFVNDSAAADRPVLVLAAFADPVPVPTGEVLLASGPLATAADGSVLLPADTTVWLRR